MQNRILFIDAYDLWTPRSIGKNNMQFQDKWAENTWMTWFNYESLLVVWKLHTNNREGLVVKDLHKKDLTSVFTLHTT